MKRLFSCMRDVASFDKTQRDNPHVPASHRLSAEPLSLPQGEYTFSYDYPLTNPAQFTHMVTPQMNAADILALAADDYRAIYKAEDTAAGGPTGNIPGMLNRGRSNGPYGIWGHSIDDLIFESCMCDSDAKRIEFGIGS